MGELGFDTGGEGGSGVIGECHDCVLWKESEDSVGEVDSVDSEPFVTRSSSFCAEAVAFIDSCGGAVTDRHA